MIIKTICKKKKTPTLITKSVNNETPSNEYIAGQRGRTQLSLRPWMSAQTQKNEMRQPQ